MLMALQKGAAPGDFGEGLQEGRCCQQMGEDRLGQEACGSCSACVVGRLRSLQSDRRPKEAKCGDWHRAAEARQGQREETSGQGPGQGWQEVKTQQQRIKSLKSLRFSVLVSFYTC